MMRKRPARHTAGRGPQPVQNHPERIDDDIKCDYGNEIKSEDDDDGGVLCCNPVQNYECVVGNVDLKDEIKEEPTEIKDEPEDEPGRNGVGWGISDDEKPVICELKDESDDVDPLKPLNIDAEVKDEPMEEEVITDYSNDFGASSVSVEVKSPAEDEDVKLEVHDEAPGSQIATVSSHVGLQDQCVNPEPKTSSSEHQTAPNHLADISQQPSTSGHHTAFRRHAEEASVIASGANTRQNPIIKIVTARKNVEVKDHIELNGYHIGPKYDSGVTKPSSKPPTHADKPEKRKCEDADPSIIVQLLVAANFLLRDRSKQKEDTVISLGRPTPLMGQLLPKVRQTDLVDGFWATEREYQIIPWLTGAKKFGKYFCWPCLLFTKEKWTLQGGESRQKFWEAISKHNLNPLHLVAQQNLKLRESELNQSMEIKPDPTIVRTNRAFLDLLIRILCTKKSRLHNTDSNFDGYEELMKVAISYEPELNQSFGDPFCEDGLVDFVSRHAHKVLSSLEAKMVVKISEEISNAPFVSIIYEDTESVVDKSTQVAVILRFVTKNVEIRERFVKLVKLGRSRNAYDVLEIHLSLVEELGIKEKLIGFTFSGTVVAPASLKQFSDMVNKNSPKAKFFHHPDHNFKETLLQSLSHLDECQRFLEVISDLVKFLTTNSGAIPTLVTFIKHSEPNCQRLEDPRSFTIDIISTIRHYYPLIIQFFFKVSQKFWNDEVAKHAPIFMKFLQEPENRFLIAVIATILDAVDVLSKVMEKDHDSTEWKTQAQKVVDNLLELQENGVDRFLYLASNGKMQQTDDHYIDAHLPEHCPATFKKIIEVAMDCVIHRAGKSEKFYVDSTYTKVSDILQAPEFWSRYGLSFESLREFHDQMNFFNIYDIDTKRSIPEIYKAVANLDVAPRFLVWRGFLRFCVLAMSPKKSTPSAPSSVVRLKSYVKEKMKFKVTEVLMFLEKDLLRSLLENEEFIEDVITHYAKKNNEYNFLYDSPQMSKLEIDKF